MKHLLLIFIFLISGLLLTGQPLSGSYTIGGTNPDYAKMSDAVYALDSLGINGPVTFDIRNGVYTDSIRMDSISGTSDTSWITFQSESGDSSSVVIRGNSGDNAALFGLNFANHIRLKSLTFEEPDPNERCVSIRKGYAFEFLNCVFKGSDNTVHEKYLMSGSIDSNLLLKNCLFTRSRKDFTGFVSRASHNISFQNCDFHGGLNALRVVDFRNFEISNCNFYGTFDGVGIRRMILLVGVRNMTMINNFIDGSQTFAQGYALEIRKTSGFDTSYIINNVILSAADNAVGSAAILFGNTSGFLVDDVFAHNTIRFESTDPSHPVFRSSDCDLPGVKMYNNIIVHESGGYIYDTCSYPTDYNLLHTTGAISPTDSNLAQLQQSGRDQHSVFAPPQFDSLLPGLSHAKEIDSAAFPLPKFPKDSRGKYRHPQFPDIGPYEFINPPKVGFPQDTSVCSQVVLDAGNPGSTYLWNTGDTTQTIVTDSAATYWVTATNSKGSDTDTTQVIIDSLALPSYQLQSNQDSLCPGGCVNLSTSLDSNQYQLVWRDTAGTLGTGSQLSHCPASLPKTYSLQISDTGLCREYDSITIYPQNSLPDISTTADTTICQSDSLLLQVNSTDSIARATWSTMGQPVDTGAAIWVQPDSLGNLYTLQLRHANGCTDSASVQLDVHHVTPPVISLKFDTLSVPDHWVSYQWLVNGNPLPNATDSALVAPQNGNFTVTITDSTGCSATSAPYNFNSFALSEIPASYIKLYPNPAWQQLTIELSPQLGQTHFSVYSATGKHIKANLRPTGAHRYRLDLGHFPSGMYFLHLTSEDMSQVRQFVKE
jgi:hypothetical protein